MSKTLNVLKKILGILLIIIGAAALVTPFTPGSWLIFVGLGLLGIQLTFWEQFKEKYWNKKDPIDRV